MLIRGREKNNLRRAALWHVLGLSFITPVYLFQDSLLYTALDAQ